MNIIHENLVKSGRFSDKSGAISVGKDSGRHQQWGVTIAEMARATGVTQRTIERNLQKLQAMGRIRRIGGRKQGSWEINRGYSDASH